MATSIGASAPNRPAAPAPKPKVDEVKKEPVQAKPKEAAPEAIADSKQESPKSGKGDQPSISQVA